MNLGDKLFHGTIFFPRWVMNNPEKTVCFQNDHIPLMNSYRDAGPAYPTEVIDEFATITFVRDCGANNESVIACAAREGANKRGNSSRLTQSFHFFMFEPIFSPVNALNQPI